SEPSEDEMKALAARPVATYSASFQIWLAELRMRRNPFAAWYSTSALSAGAPLESFWPGPPLKQAEGRDTERITLATEPIAPSERNGFATSESVAKESPNEPPGPNHLPRRMQHILEAVRAECKERQQLRWIGSSRRKRDDAIWGRLRHLGYEKESN